MARLLLRVRGRPAARTERRRAARSAGEANGPSSGAGLLNGRAVAFDGCGGVRGVYTKPAGCLQRGRDPRGASRGRDKCRVWPDPKDDAPQISASSSAESASSSRARRVSASVITTLRGFALRRLGISVSLCTGTRGRRPACSQTRAACATSSCKIPGIDDGGAGIVKITDVARHQHIVVHNRGGGDQPIGVATWALG
jgi:hypothetical protein